MAESETREPQPVNLIGIDRDTAFHALVISFTTLCALADRPTTEEDIETDGLLGMERHEVVAMDHDAWIIEARESRDRIIALIRQSRGEPANDATLSHKD